jgi:hypothetical protein
MHGSSFSGDGAKELRGLADVMQDVLSTPSYEFPVSRNAESAAD